MADSSCNAGVVHTWHKAENFGSATTSSAIGGIRDVPRQLASCPFLTDTVEKGA
jgi:hypothetical protein